MKNNVSPAATPRRKSSRRPRGKPRLIRRRPAHPAIRLNPYAWAKLLYLRDAGATEIGGFGISAVDDPLLLEDVALVAQRCDWASVAFDDDAVADHFDRQVELGRQPQEFGRVWVHTHPGNCPRPSATDEETFARVFGPCEWAVMLIVASGGASYARLAYNVGPGGSWEIPVEVAFEAEFAGADFEAWQLEYDRSVRPVLEESWIDLDQRWTIASEEARDELLC